MLQCKYCDYHRNTSVENQIPFGVYHCELMKVSLNAEIEKHAEEHPCCGAALLPSRT